MKRRTMFRLIPLSVAGLSSMLKDAYPQQDTSYKGLSTFNKEKPLAIHYLERVREMLYWIRYNQSANLLEASYLIAKTVENDRTCWSLWDTGHSQSYDLFLGRNGEPEIFTVGYDEKKSRKGDLVLVSLYGGSYDDMVKKDIFIIGGPAPHMNSAKGSETVDVDLRSWDPRPYSNIWIETNIDRFGAIMDIKGSVNKAGPVSGIIGVTTLWMMVADACRILARDGKTVAVKGDEPALPENPKNFVNGRPNSWFRNSIEKLDSPFMYRYFDKVIEQIDMISSEMGKIKKVAAMVIDTALSGGTVFCYSRYMGSLAVEGHTRRGGLALFQGICDAEDDEDFKRVNMLGYRGPMTSKDCVIMEITKPDDEIDLENLDKFRKIGMRVASIGPQTRDFVYPEGRTVPKETDIHLGTMIDTYGLFRLPGFKQKVCPTSGAINNQIYWATCMEIIEQFAERTGGDIPLIFGNVALVGKAQEMQDIIKAYKARGY